MRAFAMQGNRINRTSMGNGLNRAPMVEKSVEDQTSALSEKRWALLGLVFSLVVIGVKVFNEHYDTLHSVVFTRKLVTYEVVTESGQIMFTNAWESVSKLSSILSPLLLGVLASYFTWMCVYMDSNVPGVNPPSPFSPQKYKVQSGHTFHLNYVFALVVGVLVTSYLYLHA